MLGDNLMLNRKGPILIIHFTVIVAYYDTRYPEKGSSIDMMVFSTNPKTVINLCVLPSARYSLASYRTGHPEVLQPEAH